jgi:ABC-type nitrate/sulfonate/bicarbonate transport system substrate-binding protein
MARDREDETVQWRNRGAAAALGLVVGLAPVAGGGQEIDVLMALPAATLTFSAPFIAEDAGFYRKEGLKVTHRTWSAWDRSMR